MQSEAAKRASAKYDKENTRQVILKLNKRTDADILDWLDGISKSGASRQGAIKAALRRAMSEQ